MFLEVNTKIRSHFWVLFLFSEAVLCAQSRFIPHITRPGAGFETEIIIENLSHNQKSSAMVGFDQTGLVLGTTNLEIPGDSMRILKADDLFGPSAQLSHLTFTEDAALKVTIVYRASSRQSTPAHFEPLSEKAQRWQFFAGNWDLAFDGLAVVNLGDQPADIFLSQKEFNGPVLARECIGKKVSPNAKILYVVGAPEHQPFHAVANASFELEATQPVAVTALRGTDHGETAHLWVNSVHPRTTQTEPVSNGIEAVPTALGSQYTSQFDRYTKVTTPNGGAIHIVAQSNITEGQILRCRGILTHFLTDFPGSRYGADKSAVANKMAENNAILLLMNGSDDGRNTVTVPGQPLFENEMQVEGHRWYQEQDYEHRDATFEEILHLVHDYGIGVDGPNSSPGALPAFQAEIRAAQQNGLADKLWGIGAADWIAELTEENSLSQEYLAAVIDSYYGLWGAWTESATHAMWGIYTPKDRAEIAVEDPAGYQMINGSFFHPYLTYNARIDESFEGTFSLAFDPALPYTHHAQYLKNITLLGDKNTNVRINQWDNDVSGNAGVNTAIFSGSSDEYTIVTAPGVTTITDKIAGRDGVNRLRGIERFQFTDRIVQP